MRSNCSRSNRVAAVAVLALFSGCGYPPEKTVLLEITGVEDDRMSEAVQTILLSLVDEGTGHSISASGMDPTFVRLAPVSEIGFEWQEGNGHGHQEQADFRRKAPERASQRRLFSLHVHRFASASGFTDADCATAPP